MNTTNIQRSTVSMVAALILVTAAFTIFNTREDVSQAFITKSRITAQKALAMPLPLQTRTVPQIHPLTGVPQADYLDVPIAPVVLPSNGSSHSASAIDIKVPILLPVMAFACLVIWHYFKRNQTSSKQTAMVSVSSVLHSSPGDKRTQSKFFTLTQPELAAILGGSGRAKMVWEAVREGHSPFHNTAGEGISQGAQQTLQHHMGSDSIACTTIVAESHSSCGTLKFVQRCASSDHLFESVLIPHATLPRTTLCVSSQVGCNRGCAFCATGRMGLLANLTAEEILSQVYHGLSLVRREKMPPLTNVVFMGMGDAGCNLLAVRPAVEALTDPMRFRFAPSRCTVSTVGPSPSIFPQLATLPASLAWSLHAAEDSLRQRLVPSTRHSTVQLRDALIEALLSRPSKRQTKVMVAVTMLADLNDREVDAVTLAEFLEPLRQSSIEVAVDLIPYNDTGLPEFRRSTDEQIRAFANILNASGFHCSIRVSRGDSEAAACGQLTTATMKSKQAEPQ